MLPSLSIFEDNFEVWDVVRCGPDTIILYVLVLQGEQLKAPITVSEILS